MYDLPDPAFVGAAYQRVLGRTADPAGFCQYLELLRAGKITRARLLGMLQASDEAASAQPASLARAGRHGVLWPANSAVPRRRLVRNRKELLELRGEVFVECAYMWRMGRLPSAAELQHALPAETASQRAALLDRLGSRRGGWPWHRAKPVGSVMQHPAPVEAPAQPMAAPWQGLDAAYADGTAFFTIASRRYRPLVEVLMASLRRHHPASRRFLLLVDEPVANDPPMGDLCETVPAAAIDVPCFDDMTLRYDVMELSTALKPWFLRWLFAHTALERLVYLDPDVCVYSPLTPVFELLERGHTAVLTPHITQPLGDEDEPSDLSILKSGTYNLGFAAFRRCPESHAFIDWWCKQVRTGAVVDFAANLFTDQRWCDLAPAFMPGLAILRHPGCNVAYWNLAHREVTRDRQGVWHVAGMPLCFFHFSGIDPADRSLLSRHQSRFAPGEPPGVQPLLDEYRDEVLHRGWPHWRLAAASYDHVAGVPLPTLARALYRRLHPCPAATSRDEAMHELLRQSAVLAAAPAAANPTLPALMLLVHSQRADLARQFDLATSGGRRALTDWFLASGVHAPGLLEFVHAAQRTAASL